MTLIAVSFCSALLCRAAVTVLIRCCAVVILPYRTRDEVVRLNLRWTIWTMTSRMWRMSR